MNKKGSFPHKLKVGQVVYWGNGAEKYVSIQSLEPLHCDGGCPSYRVSKSSQSFYRNIKPYSLASEGPVSEEVLRPLTKEERLGNVQR
jgi:hypothetical protein